MNKKRTIERLRQHTNNKESKTIYDPTNTRVFRKRMEDSFPSIYLNGISIIQGVALGLLCEQIFKDITPENQNIFFATWNHPIKNFYALMSLCCIICVLYEYNWFVGTYRWSQKLIDTLIPVFLGFFEIAAILNINTHYNWWLYTFFSVSQVS